MARTQAICARIATADDHHVLARRQDPKRIRNRIAFAAPILLRQEFHRKVNALQLASRYRQIARLFRSARQQDRVILVLQILHRQALPHVGFGHEPNAFRRQLLQAPIQNTFVELEIRDAVAKQSADAIGFFIHGDPMSGAIQLLRSSQSRGT